MSMQVSQAKNNQISIRDSNSVSLLPTREEFEIIQMIAKTASECSHFKALGGFPGILSIALYAKEVGIPIMTALMGGVVNVQGKITIAPEMMNSLIRQAGHRVEIMEATHEICKIRGTRRDSGETWISSYTIQDAAKAGLIRPNSGWEKYPSDMLFARCISKLKRRLFPDCSSVSYVHGEIDEESPCQADLNTSTGEIQTVQVEAEDRKISQDSADLIDNLIKEHIDPFDKDYRSRFLDFYKVNSISDIKLEKQSKAIEGVNKKIEHLKKTELELKSS